MLYIAFLITLIVGCKNGSIGTIITGAIGMVVCSAASCAIWAYRYYEEKREIDEIVNSYFTKTRMDKIRAKGQ